MNLDTQLALSAYSQKVNPEWKNRQHEQVAESLLQKHRGNHLHAANDAVRMEVHFPQGRDAGFWQRVKGHIESLKAAGCKGPNCGRKGKKAGATPLRSFMTKQETDTLKSKTLKFKRRRKY